MTSSPSDSIPLEKTGGVLNALARDLGDWQREAPVIDATHEEMRAVIDAAMLLRGFLTQRGPNQKGGERSSQERARAMLDEFWAADAAYRNAAGGGDTAERLTVAEAHLLDVIEAGLLRGTGV